MNRWSLALIVGGMVASGATLRHADPALPAVYVELQGSTPGTTQTGNINVSGSILGGIFSASSSDSAAKVLTANATSASGTTYAGIFQNASSTGRAIYASADAATGVNYGGYFRSSSSDGIAVYGSASGAGGANYGAYLRAGGSSGTAVYGLAESTSGSTFGGKFVSMSNTGRGIYGEGRYGGQLVGGSIGLDASATSDNGIGVYAVAGGYGFKGGGRIAGGYFTCSGEGYYGVYGSNPTGSTGTTYGGYFYSAADQGIGVFGWIGSVSGTSFAGKFGNPSSSGTGVYAYATSESGQTYGLKAEAASSMGRAVYADASATSGSTYGGYFSAHSSSSIALYGSVDATSGYTYGVRGRADSTSETGVYGTATATSGTTNGGYFRTASEGGRGVFGYAASSAGGYGVIGYTAAASGFSVYALGDMGASGTKSFRIDHPFDPENMYLHHYCSEGPEPLNVYRGTIVTDEKGYATVTLPDYFDEINKEPSYQLTVIDDSEDFVLAKVTEPEQGGRFKIRTNKPGVRVCWEVKATRNDAYVRKYGAPIETQKPPSERGTYQHPELYGKPDSMRLGHE